MRFMNHRQPFLVDRFTDARSRIRALFDEADDSKREVDSYLEAGEVLVARRGSDILGHIQFIITGVRCEIKSLAVRKDCRRQGTGAALLRSVLKIADAKGCVQVETSTATADLGNLRFYQRLGFRMDRIERDVFTPERGYRDAEIDGIPLRDRVWFSIETLVSY